MKKTRKNLQPKKKASQSGNGYLNKLVQVDKGVISSRIFNDPEINRLEMERIFTRSWLYVAHESEIPQIGDFVTRYMGEDPVIVWRGQDKKVRVFLNVCRHRGMRVCGQDVGKASQFRCSYHGWTYSNLGELISVPFYEGYHGALDMSSLGLCQAPRVESYHGLVFAHWEPKGQSLDDYLGEMKWVLDILFGRSAEMEVVGAPMRWEADANWKLGAANFSGDGVHLFTTHGFRSALGLEDKMQGERQSYRMITENGHASSLSGFAGKFAMGLPEELRPEMERNLTAQQLKFLDPLLIAVGNVFPNMSFLNSGQHTSAEWGGGDAGKDVVSFLTLRLWQPKGADKMEIWSWCLVDKNTSEEWKRASKESYLRVFGAGGMFEQDDMENWGEITQGLRGPIAKRLMLQYKMGVGGPRKDRPIKGLKDMMVGGLSEDSERSFYRHWQKLMMQE